MQDMYSAGFYLESKKIFVLSTNADKQFVKAGLPEEKY